MRAELRPFPYRRRLAGIAATLIVLALLAFVLSRPIDQTFVERAPEIVSVMDLTPVATPDVQPVIPLQNVDMSIPKIMVNLPEFETSVAPPTLTSDAPLVSPDASPAPSGSESRIGMPDGTGRTGGSRAGRAGTGLIPPVRTGGADVPFDLKSASRAGRVTSLNFCVTEDGRTSHVQLAASSGFRDMDAIAIDWLAQQQFTPATLDDVRVRTCATYDVRWSYSRATSFEARDAAKAHAETIRRRSRYPRQFVYWPEDRPFPGCDAITVCRAHVE